MTDFTILDLYEVTAWDNPELVQARQGINAKISNILDRREQISRTLDSCEQAALESLTIEQLNETRAAKCNLFTLLQDEIKLRTDDIPAFERLSSETASKAFDANGQKHRDLEASIAQDLEKIGFLRHVPAIQTQGSWTPSMIFGHPEIIASRGRSAAYQSGASDPSWRQVNQTAIEKAKAALGSLRTQLVG